VTWRRPPRILTAWMLAVLVLSAVAAKADAHLLPAQAVTLNVRGLAVFAALSIPVTALTGFDDDQDARLSVQELSVHHAPLRAQLERGITLVDGDDAGTLEFFELSIEPDDHVSDTAQRSTHVLVLFKRTFRAEPRDLRLTMRVFGRTENERRYAVRAVQQGRSESAVLSVDRDSHKFFRTSMDRFGVIGGLLLVCAIALLVTGYGRVA
jgi:hypothetical protein